MTGLALTPDGRLAGATFDDPHLRRVLDLLNPAAEETRLVGGAVRNALLGRPAGDLDLATTLRPDAVQSLARAARLRTIPTGIAHGTVTIVAGGRPFEVTTLREDVETDGRHAVVRFGRDFEADARRRDLTINALSAGRDARLFDYVGGLDDLALGRVRFIGDADQRIREDYLRILRFFRFHATYGDGPLDAAGVAAVIAHRDGLARLSRERVRAEVLKILAAPGVAATVLAMQETGILAAILDPPADPVRMARLLAVEPGNALLRLAALALRDVGEVDGVQRSLRLSNAEANRLRAALAARQSLGTGPVSLDASALRRLLFVHGREAAADALRLAFADQERPEVDAWAHAIVATGEIAVPVLPVSGRDLMLRGLAGPALGAALARFKAAWADAGFPEDGAVVTALLDAAVAAERDQAQATS